MTGLPAQSASPIVSHGFVDIIPIALLSYQILDFVTCDTPFPVSDTMSHSFMPPSSA